MKILVRFSPLIASMLGTHLINWRVGMLTGLVTLLIVTMASTSRRLDILGGAMLAYFATFSVLSVLAPGLAIHAYINAIGLAWLALVAVGSVAVGHPFTLDFASEGVSDEVAASPRFLRVNEAITKTWAAAFAAAALIDLIGDVTDRSVLATIAAVLVLHVAVKHSKPNSARREDPDQVAELAHHS